MSLYNMVNGVNPATFLLLPMLGKHPDEYPRFRDCFMGAATNSKTEKDQFGIPKKELSDEKVITIYTRTGGANRESYQEEIDKLRSMPTYIRDYDDTFDSTFAMFIFSIPEKWQADYEKINNGDTEISEEYKAEMKRVYPKLADKFEQMFN